MVPRTTTARTVSRPRHFSGTQAGLGFVHSFFAELELPRRALVGHGPGSRRARRVSVKVDLPTRLSCGFSRLLGRTRRRSATDRRRRRCPSRRLLTFVEWLQDHDRRFGGPQGRIRVDVVTHIAPHSPQACSFVSLRRAARTDRDPSARSTLATGCAWRLSHQAGSPSAQPFMARVTRFGPSS